MLNKIYKNIHIKKSKLFKFLFYLTHIIVLFLIAFSLFLSIPKFFDYKKKVEHVREYLNKNYNLKLKNFSLIEYNVFPLPNLLLKNVNLELENKPISLSSKEIKIYLKLKDIYNKKAIISQKIYIDKPSVSLNIDSFKELLKYLTELDKKLSFKHGAIDLLKDNKTLFTIKKLNYSNFGFKKNQFSGNLFNKKFKATIKGKNEDINFKILDTGVKAYLKFDRIDPDETVIGSSRINILNNFLKLDFRFREGEIEIVKSIFRNRNLSITSTGLIKLNPFFNLNLDTTINKIDKNFFENISLKKVILNKEIIKKINGSNKIRYKIKASKKDITENIFLKIDLAYGRLNILKEIDILGGKIICKGDSIITEDYPRLFFNCDFDIKDKKKLFKKISLLNKYNDNTFILRVSGNLNVLNKKINFEEISIDNLYTANNEDMEYFKYSFEKVLFNEGFFNIFHISKIKNFLREII